MTINNMLYGGPGEIRTRVLNPFQSTSYSLNLQYIFIVEECQQKGPEGPFYILKNLLTQRLMLVIIFPIVCQP